MKVLDWYKGNKKMRIEQVEIVISKIIKMSYILLQRVGQAV